MTTLHAIAAFGGLLLTLNVAVPLALGPLLRAAGIGQTTPADEIGRA